jgi:outer membrane lipoprotein SlyB
MDSFRHTALAAGIAAAMLLLGVGLIFMITDGLRGAQSQERSSGTAVGSEAGSNSTKASNCAICGTVESVRIVEVRMETEGTGIKSNESDDLAAGRPAGQGNEKASTTILGVTGGFFSGSSGVESGSRKRNAYRVTVRMDDGSYRTVSLSSPPAFAVGDKVRVIEGKLVRA